MKKADPLIATRLRQAREAAGYCTAEDFANAFGHTSSTYRGHENASRGFAIATAIIYARQLNCSADWLLTGEGDAKKFEIPLRGYINGAWHVGAIRGAANDSALEEKKVVMPLLSGVEALEVAEKVHLVLKPGSLLYLAPRINQNFSELVGGLPCWVQIKGGPSVIGDIMLGYENGRFNLMTFDRSFHQDIEIEWAAQVAAIAPSA